jgi:transposase InsO family protein
MEPAQVAEFIRDQRAGHHIPQRVACRALGVSESWFCKWTDRPMTGRQVRMGLLSEETERIFKDSGGTCGSPKIFIELVRAGWRIPVNTVAKLMAELGLVARVVRRRAGLTRPGKRPAAPGLAAARLLRPGARHDLGRGHDGDRDR